MGYIERWSQIQRMLARGSQDSRAANINRGIPEMGKKGKIEFPINLLRSRKSSGCTRLECVDWNPDRSDSIRLKAHVPKLISGAEISQKILEFSRFQTFPNGRSKLAKNPEFSPALVEEKPSTSRGELRTLGVWSDTLADSWTTPT